MVWDINTMTNFHINLFSFSQHHFLRRLSSLLCAPDSFIFHKLSIVVWSYIWALFYSIDLCVCFCSHVRGGLDLLFCISLSSKKTILHFFLWSSISAPLSLYVKWVWLLMLSSSSQQHSNANFLHLFGKTLLYLIFCLWKKLFNSIGFIMLSWADNEPLSFIFSVCFLSFMF